MHDPRSTRKRAWPTAALYRNYRAIAARRTSRTASRQRNGSEPHPFTPVALRAMMTALDPHRISGDPDITGELLY